MACLQNCWNCLMLSTEPLGVISLWYLSAQLVFPNSTDAPYPGRSFATVSTLHIVPLCSDALGM